MSQYVSTENMEEWETDVFGYNIMHVNQTSMYVLVVTGDKARKELTDSCKCSFWVRLSVQPTHADIFSDPIVS